MSVAQQLQNLLQQALPEIQHLEVQDESAAHARGSESHFRLTLVTPSFISLSRVQRHRLIYHHLEQPMQHIHALALHTYTPDEWAARDKTTTASPACAGGSDRT